MELTTTIGLSIMKLFTLFCSVLVVTASATKSSKLSPSVYPEIPPSERSPPVSDTVASNSSTTSTQSCLKNWQAWLDHVIIASKALGPIISNESVWTPFGRLATFRLETCNTYHSCGIRIRADVKSITRYTSPESATAFDYVELPIREGPSLAQLIVDRPPTCSIPELDCKQDWSHSLVPRVAYALQDLARDFVPYLNKTGIDLFGCKMPQAVTDKCLVWPFLDGDNFNPLATCANEGSRGFASEDLAACAATPSSIYGYVDEGGDPRRIRLLDHARLDESGSCNIPADTCAEQVGMVEEDTKNVARWKCYWQSCIAKNHSSIGSWSPNTDRTILEWSPANDKGNQYQPLIVDSSASYHCELYADLALEWQRKGAPANWRGPRELPSVRVFSVPQPVQGITLEVPNPAMEQLTKQSPQAGLPEVTESTDIPSEPQALGQHQTNNKAKPPPQEGAVHEVPLDNYPPYRPSNNAYLNTPSSDDSPNPPLKATILKATVALGSITVTATQVAGTPAVARIGDTTLSEGRPAYTTGGHTVRLVDGALVVDDGIPIFFNPTKSEDLNQVSANGVTGSLGSDSRGDAIGSPARGSVKPHPARVGSAGSAVAAAGSVGSDIADTNSTDLGLARTGSGGTNSAEFGSLHDKPAEPDASSMIGTMQGSMGKESNKDSAAGTHSIMPGIINPDSNDKGFGGKASKPKSAFAKSSGSTTRSPPCVRWSTISLLLGYTVLFRAVTFH